MRQQSFQRNIRVFGGDDGKSEDEDNMHIQKKESSSIPPYVKTMELMIENRLTQLTSK